ncbi:pentapeptide repeat-containing protein [Calothrix sp. PCC 7507]|uniref:pentapeptide repeat-containing protein n=1 Tax=Calothrix sp. PCC 7507 TaxID=99598 RepID=UPI00029F0299|nr:pentapeptide repeat-containing protein [Calothrix sp. PCC 7507]AFY32442.1 pentapeptide repeat protein [Calothrix sp. PCC 7507]
MNAYQATKNWLNKNNIHLKLLYLQVIPTQKPRKNHHNQSPRQRFRIAINDINNCNIEARLAAIDDLEQIAQSETNFHWEIMEILTKFVRNHASHLPQTDNQLDLSSTICIDIQAALTVIARRDTKQDPENEQLDLSHTNMMGANLCGASLENTNLYQANLSGADLRGANLYGAILTAANLKGANLSGANLAKAIFSAANLEAANLSGANLYRANLYLANLHQAILNDAILNQANLRDCQLPHLDTLDMNLGDM